MEVGTWQQIAFLAMPSLKLRLVDWIGLTVLAFLTCGRALVFFVTQSGERLVGVAF